MKAWRSVVLMVLAGTALVLAGHLSLSGDSPSLRHPGSLLLALPFFLGVSPSVTYLIGPALLWLWQPALFRGATQVPLRSLILFVIVAAVSIGLLATGWKWGVQYQGLAFMRGIALINLFCVCGLAFLLFYGRRRPSFPINLVGHWLFATWMVTYAFPYIGEMP